MTNHWVDIKNADVVLIMGGNAAEAHPCGFKWVTEAKAHNKARLIVVDPRFTRSASVADVYAPIRTGTDIAFLGGVINYLLANDKIQHEYVQNYTDFTFIVREDFTFEDGLYSGYDADKHSYDKSSWDYEIGADGYVKTDPTLAHPRCVYQLMKQHYARYTPEMVERICGTPQEKFLQICEMLASTATPTRAMTIMYALGWTQHSVGTQMIRTGAMVQLLLGNIGIAGGGMNALRGHSNIQGLTDLGLMSNLLPGLHDAADREGAGLRQVHRRARLQAAAAEPAELLAELRQVLRELHEGLVGRRGHRREPLGLRLPAQARQALRHAAVLRAHGPGQDERLHLPGVQSRWPPRPTRRSSIWRSRKLKFLVVMDPLATETSEFWRNYRRAQRRRLVARSRPRCSGCRPPASPRRTARSRTPRAGCSGTGRARTPRARRARNLQIMGELFTRMRALYQSQGGAFPDPIVKLSWPYANPESPTPEELATEYSGKALKDLADPKDPTKVTRKAGEQLAGFAELRNDGSTASRLLDLLRRLGAEPATSWRGATTPIPTGIGQTRQLGLGVAREPPRALQPRLLRSERQALQPATAS